MAIEVKIPQISEGVDTAQVAEILVSEGDSITKDQSVIAVETDKASVEVPSSDAGKVKEIKVKEGDEVKVGDVILILEEEEESSKDDEEESSDEEEKEDKSQESKDKEAKESKSKDEQDKKAKDEKKKVNEEKKDKKDKEAQEEDQGKKDQEEDQEEEVTEEKTKNQEQKSTKGQDENVPASPSVRRLAREIGVDIASISGSGPGGRITAEDVKSQSKEKTQKDSSIKNTELPDFSQWGSISKEPLSNIRKSIAKNMATAWNTVPHVFQFDEADISGIQEYMKENEEKAAEAGGKLTLTAVLLKVMANALQQFPIFNASLDMDNEEVILKNYYHIGIAVDTEKGLLVPVIRDVNQKSIIDLAVALSELAEKARSGKLEPEEMKGGNITISNLGGIGGTNFTPIVYPTQVAVLGISRAKQQPVFLDGSFQPRPILPLSLSYDHRLIDGAAGAEFLRWICQALEDPYKALLGS